MDLLDLEPLFAHLGVEPTAAQRNAIFDAFKRDFIDRALVIDGLRVKIILKNSSVEGFESFPETLAHLITRKSAGGKRVFDPHRANKIHWIRPILENKDSEDICYFVYIEDDGAVRDYYWFKEGRFIVIMEKVTPSYLIITSFNVDAENERHYTRRYDAYRRRT